MTPAEERLWNELQAKRFRSVKFRRQHRIGNYIVDFYCGKAGLIIELEGTIHLKRKEYDEERFAILRAAGYRVLRFDNEEVLDDVQSVLDKIYSCLALNVRPVISIKKRRSGRDGKVQYSQ